MTGLFRRLALIGSQIARLIVGVVGLFYPILAVALILQAPPNRPGGGLLVRRP